MSEKQAGEEKGVHLYDDIEEHDNPLPLWWLVTFFGTVVFSVFYFYQHEIFHMAPRPLDELAAELAEAEKKGQGEIKPADIEALATDAKSAADGAAVYQSTCMPCHGDKGEGKIGPNLTDKFWKHGGKPMNVYTSISKGVPDKGMPAWGASLGPTKVKQVTAFVLSIKNKNVEGGKAPEGEEEKGN